MGDAVGKHHFQEQKQGGGCQFPEQHISDAELRVVWTDFDPELPAVYYARVLEIPTPRWTAYDAVRHGIEMPSPDVPMITQDRAYTSPIWYTPGG